MATNLARAQHRLKKAKAELAKVKQELAQSKRETKDYRLMLDGSRVRVVQGVMKLKAANGTIQRLQQNLNVSRVVAQVSMDLSNRLLSTLERHHSGIGSLN
jgi:hypothetical protein